MSRDRIHRVPDNPHVRRPPDPAGTPAHADGHIPAAPARALSVPATQRHTPGQAALRTVAIQQMQSVLGNRATRRFLQRGNQGTAAARRLPAVQRFGPQSIGKPIKWEAEMTRAERSGEGASGGVYFVTSAGGSLVVKPELVDGGEIVSYAEQDQFADKFLSKGMGVGVSKSRSIQINTSEGQELKRAILQTLVGSEEKKEEVSKDLDNTFFFKIMEKLGGSTISSLARGATDQQKVTALALTLSQPGLLHQLGELVIADGMLGNVDRLDKFKANLGNILLNDTADKIYAIDSTAYLPKVNFANVKEGGVRSLQSIEDTLNADLVFASLLAGLLMYIPATENFDGKAFFRQEYNQDQAKLLLKEGITRGIQKVRQLSGNTGKEGFKEKGLKAESKVKHSVGKDLQQKAMGIVNWDRLKVNQLYLDLRSRGLTAEEAKEELQRYANHRKQRAEKLKVNRPKLDKEYKQDMEQRVNELLKNRVIN